MSEAPLYRPYIVTIHHTAALSLQMLALRAQGAEFRIWVRVYGLQLTVDGTGSMVKGLGRKLKESCSVGIRVQGSGLRVKVSGLRRFRIEGPGLKVQGQGLRVQGLRSRVQGSEFRV